MKKRSIASPVARFGTILPLLAAACATEPETGGVCDRTPGVRDEIVRVAGAPDCGAVTPADLAGIASLDLLGLRGLSVGDLAGLTGLETLSLVGYLSATLPEGVFSGLTSLLGLSVFDTELETLPAGVFSGLTSLQGLSIRANDELATLPAGVFSGLVSLRRLTLMHNFELETLPAEVFSALASLRNLRLTENVLASLPEGAFSGLEGLELLDLSANRLASLPEGVFSGLASLERLDLRNNPGAPFELALRFERTDGTGTDASPASVRLVLAEGAPATIVAPLSVEGGGASSSAALLPAGSTEGPTFTVVQHTAGRPTIVRPSSVPSLTFGGLSLVAPSDLVLFSSGVGRP